LDFVQFLVHKEPERQQLTQAASRLSESTLAAIWENADDAAYDQL
jgi:TorA maturation chaperone TorD